MPRLLPGVGGGGHAVEIVGRHRPAGGFHDPGHDFRAGIPLLPAVSMGRHTRRHSQQLLELPGRNVIRAAPIVERHGHM